MDRRPAAEEAVDNDRSTEAVALSVTHWFESGPAGAPYEAKVRFSGRRIGGAPKRDRRDSFIKDEAVSRVVPGSGRVSVTTWVHGISAGEWEVTAELVSR